MGDGHMAFPYNFKMGTLFLYKSLEKKHSIYNAIGIFPTIVWVLLLISLGSASAFFSTTGILYSNLPNKRLLRANADFGDFFFVTLQSFVEPLEKSLFLSWSAGIIYVHCKALETKLANSINFTAIILMLIPSS